MIQAQNIVFGQSINPVSTTGALTGTAIDTLLPSYVGSGYGFLVVNFGAIGAATTKLAVQESADGSTGWADISGGAASGSTGEGRLPQTADANTAFVVYFPMGGARKRYVRAAVTAGGSATLVSAVFGFLPSGITPTTAAAIGASGRIVADAV